MILLIFFWLAIYQYNEFESSGLPEDQEGSMAVVVILCKLFTLFLRTGLQQYLYNRLNDLQMDNVVHILNSACTNESAELQSLCLSAIASSNIDNITLEKEVRGAMLEQVRQIRIELGSDAPYLDSAQESQCKQIHRQCFCLWQISAKVPGKWVALSP